MDEKFKPFETTDEDGNEWYFGMQVSEKNPSRHNLIFKFNKKDFKLNFYPTKKDAEQMWELITFLSKEKKTESEK